jgi:hypothetical protein
LQGLFTIKDLRLADAIAHVHTVGREAIDPV